MSETEVEVQDAVVSPDKCISKIEVVDTEFLRQLSVNPDVEKDERTKLKRILKSLKKGNQLEVLYKLGKHCKHNDLGRWIALQGNGLQAISKQIRNAIASANYIDVDMINAQPSLLVDYCVKKGWECSALKKYIAERDSMLESVMDFCSIPRWEAKQKIVSVLFGHSPAFLPEFFKVDFYKEIRKIQELMWKENEKDLKWLGKRPNPMASGMAYILQTEERKCLEAMDLALAKRGRSLDTYIHDGGLVRKKEGEVTLTQAFLEEIEEDVKTATGYGIKLAVKPMETSWEKEEEATGSDYLSKKAEFEKEYFKLMKPSCFVRLYKGHAETLMAKDLIHQRQNYLLSDDTPFISTWVKDPNIRTYEELVFAPKMEVPPNVYNLFTEFRVPPQEGADISVVKEVLRVMCNSDENVMNYVEKWVAHIIQKPYVKTEVAIVVQGQEGIGKDTFWNFIGSILGDNEYFYSTKNPENNVFHNFNSGTEKCVLVKFEEADFKTNMANKNKLKGIITCSKETYTKKGHDGVTLDDYRNFVMTTNDDIPVVVSDSDRRFVLIHASEEKKRDTAFWKRTHDALNDVRVKASYHHYLLNLDIKGFVPNSPADRVITDYYKEVKQSLAPYHAKWFYDYIETAKITRMALGVAEPTTNPTWFAYNLYGAMKETYKWDYTFARFRKDITEYIKAEAITSKRSGAGVEYSLDVAKCLEFMRSKDWIASD
jgi:hypothetical protein